MNLICVLFVVFFLTEHLEFHGNVGVQAILDGTYVNSIEGGNFLVGFFFEGEHGCVGTIVDKDRVVTAAHCMQRYGYTLSFGSLDTSDYYYTEYITQSDIVVHPEYIRYPHVTNDIAVVLLKSPLDFSNKRFGKIQMVAKNDVPKTGDVVSVYGFSRSEHPWRIKQIDKLQYRNSTIYDFSKCQTEYEQRDGGWLDKNTIICVSLRNGVHNRNEGDSGAPLLTQDRKFLGIVSSGWPEMPEIYTYVGAYLDFIADPRGFSSRYHGSRNPHSFNMGSYGYPFGMGSHSFNEGAYQMEPSSSDPFESSSLHSIEPSSSSPSAESTQPSSSSDSTKTSAPVLLDKIDQHKYIALMLYETDTDGPYINTATIFSPNKIVTSAQNIADKSVSVTLSFGTLDASNTNYTVNVSRSEIFIHPEYDADSSHANDLAVILLKKPIKFGRKVGKIDGMVDKKFITGPDDEVTMFGFSESRLRYINTTVAEFVACRYAYWERNNYRVLEEGKQFCVNTGGTGLSCGYTGGPIFTKDKRFLGIISYDYTDLPEICTSVTGSNWEFITNPRTFIANHKKELLKAKNKKK
ncbi:uncharacterized protein LOC116348568 isoform X2 [Contarinia nasturtii]|uniref:uncharacterized protein LOC116348568 isoform X2 n=1 Tax=Contarinia nasturtii TaxID=265458 RepID=UPI0012D44713|nr:uncharacterized protein LOC116348568 isoform X2 [Contarinia nasturtii]